MSDESREIRAIELFNKYDNKKRIRVILITALIAIVLFTIVYTLIRLFMMYTVTFELNGGGVYKSIVEDQKAPYRGTITEPKNVKKEGYYLEGWYLDKACTRKFSFDSEITHSLTLYANWKEGYAVRLHFVENEENSFLSFADLKGYYEEYFEPGTIYNVPLIYNTTDTVHGGEQLLWFDNTELTGAPFQERAYTLDRNYDIYGSWFETNPEKFVISADGTLTRYLGRCVNVILPETVVKIKDIPYDKFTTGESDVLYDLPGTYHSVWQNVITGDIRGLNKVYLNRNLQYIGECAFMDCENLEIVGFLGDTLESIGAWAFAKCTNLRIINLPSSINKIPSHCFDGSFKESAKINFVVNNNIQTIESSAFLGSFIFGLEINGVGYIENLAFASCDNLSEVVLNTDRVIEVEVVDVSVGDATEYLNNNNVDTSAMTDEEIINKYREVHQIFFSTYTSVTTNNKLIIKVYPNLVDSYKSTYPWSLYANVITNK